MKRTTLSLLCALAVVSAVAAPPKKATAAGAPASQAAVAADPVSDFKALVASASEPKEWTGVHQNSRTQKWSKQQFTAGEIKYDIKKTDSLISPVKGLVSFPVTMRMSEYFDTKEDAEAAPVAPTRRLTSYLTGEYDLIDGAWRLDKFSYYSAFGDAAPNRDVETITRDKLTKNLGNGTGMAMILEKWFR